MCFCSDIFTNKKFDQIKIGQKTTAAYPALKEESLVLQQTRLRQLVLYYLEMTAQTQAIWPQTTPTL